MAVVVPWATDSQLGGGDGVNVGGGFGNACYGSGLGEAFKSPRDSLLKKKQDEWIEGKKSPETTVPVPTAFPEKQVKQDRSSFLLGQDSPVDPLELAERTSRRKLASEVQKVLLEQISERVQKQKQNRVDKAIAREEAKPEAEVKGKPEVKCELGGGPELVLMVVQPSGKGSVQLDKKGKTAQQLEKMSKKQKLKLESVKEREIKVRAELLEKKKKKELEKEAAKGFTEKFLKKGRLMMEEAEKAARNLFGILKPRKVSVGSKPVIESRGMGTALGTDAKLAGNKPVFMETESPSVVKQDNKPCTSVELDDAVKAAGEMPASMENKLQINVKETVTSGSVCVLKQEVPLSVDLDSVLANATPGLSVVTEGSKIATISDLNVKDVRGKVPSKLPILKVELRTGNYNLPRVVRGTGLRYMRVKMELALTEDKPVELPDAQKLLVGVVRSNGDGVDPPSGAAIAAPSSLTKKAEKKSRIPILAREKRTSSYSPPRKVFKTGLRYVPNDASGAE